MDEAQRAMATWIGTLTRGGVLYGDGEEAGVAVAAFVVGTEDLSSLREWFADASDEVRVREQRAAVEVCIWMAHADRVVVHEEAELLRAIVMATDLEESARRALLDEVAEPPPLADIAERLTEPTLRELMLALGWELACSDGRIDPLEVELHDGLAKRLGVLPARAQEIRDSIQQQVDDGTKQQVDDGAK